MLVEVESNGTIYNNPSVTYNGTSDTLTSPNFAGNLTGNASSATIAAAYLPLSGGTLTGDITVGSGQTSSNIYMADSNGTQRRIHTNSNRIGFLNSSNNWGAYCDNGGNWYSDHSMRAPIFYDSNDTTYFTNPAGTSNLLQLTVPGSSNGWSAQLGTASTSRVYNDSARASLVINSVNYPHLYINATGGTSNTNHGGVISMTGNTSSGYRRWSMGWPSYNPTVFSMGAYDDTANPHYGCGGTLGVASWGSRFWFDTSGNGQAHASWRAPIFYDSNNTGYYLNPASTSSLNAVTWAGGSSANANTAYTHSQAAHAPTDAEANVQADWTAASGDAHILNKPTIPSGNSILDWTADQGSSNIHANNIVGYINTTEPNEPFNPFAGQKFHDGVLTNALVGRHDRFVVTIDGTTEAGASYKLSNQNFEEYNQNRLFGTSAGETRVFNINIQSLASGSPATNGITYSAGFFDINFYSSPFPASWSARVKNKNGDWYNVTNLIKIGNSKLRGVIPISNWLTDIEFTLTARTSAPFVTGNITYGISEFELFFSRMAASQGGNISSLGGYLGGTITTASGTTSTNWNTAYTHSQATHAPTDAEANVQADWDAADGDAHILNKPTIPAAVTDFVSKSSGGNFEGDLSVHTGAGTGSLSVGRTSDQSIKLYVTDVNNSITATQDSDGDQEHNFILNRTFAGTGNNNFKIQKGGTSQLLINKDGQVTIPGDAVISGNLTVDGTTTTLNTATVEVEDNIIVLNDNKKII
jgi:hypothetical protein